MLTAKQSFVLVNCFCLFFSLQVTGTFAQNSLSGTSDSPLVEETVLITGRAQSLYRTGETTTGKLPTEPLDSSQLITSINEALIRDQGARDAQDLYRNISGVSFFSYAGVTARGFRQEGIFFDGLRGDPYVGFNVPQLFNIERVDFLKGPAGMLYGPGAPGGVFNYVTKKPSRDFYARSKAILGDNSRVGGSAEINGALPVDGLAGRVGIFYEDQETTRFNSERETGIYDLGFSADLNFATLILQATRYEQDQPGNRLRGVPHDENGKFITDIRWNHNEPGDFLNLESDNVQAILKSNGDTSVSWDITLRKTESEQEQKYHEPRTPVDINGDDTPDLMFREFRDQLREEENLTLGANLTWDADFDIWQNRLMVGYEFFDGEEYALLGAARVNSDMVQRYLTGMALASDIGPLSILNPEYGQSDYRNYDVIFRAPRLTEQTRSGFYLLNEVTIGKFIAVAGLRFDEFEDEFDGDLTDEEGPDSFDDDKLTGRFGLIYKINDEASLFAQWADSYEPQAIDSQAPARGGPFDPQTGTIYETGLKTELFGGRIQTSASIYEITRENILQADPNQSDDEDRLIAFGEVSSNGLELDLVADLTPNWVFTAAWAYNKTLITQLFEKEDGSTSEFRNSNKGQFANAPKHQFGFWTRYQVQSINTAFAMGGDFVSDRISLSGKKVPEYFVFDASIIWEPGPVDVLLRINNLFDREYAASGFLERTGHFPGEQRAVFVEVSKEWH